MLQPSFHFPKSPGARSEFPPARGRRPRRFPQASPSSWRDDYGSSAGADEVSSLPLREIHRLVGGLQQFLRRRALLLIRSDAEARRDPLLRQQRLFGYPSPQFFRQLVGLISSGLGHQDHELVATVARHHVAAPAVMV